VGNFFEKNGTNHKGYPLHHAGRRLGGSQNREEKNAKTSEAQRQKEALQAVFREKSVIPTGF
jgi:hypothetical protein